MDTYNAIKKLQEEVAYIRGETRPEEDKGLQKERLELAKKLDWLTEKVEESLKRLDWIDGQIQKLKANAELPAEGAGGDDVAKIEKPAAKKSTRKKGA